MAKSVSQSNTMWVKKGTVVNGEAVKKGYLAQYGKPEKKVTNKVKMVVDTGGVKAGQTQAYKEGRRVKATPPGSSSRTGGAGAGSTAAAKPAAPAAGMKKDVWQKGAAARGKATAKNATPTPSTSMNRPGQKPPGAAAYSKAQAAKGGKSGKAGMVYVPSINQYVPKAGWNEKTNPYNKGRVTGGPQNRKDVPAATLAALSLYGGGRLLGATKAGKAAVAGAKNLASKVASKAGGKGGAAATAAAQAAPNSKVGTTKGVSKVTGGALKSGKPAAYGPKKPTAAQAAQSKRQQAAQKAAATRKANAAAAAKKKGGKK